MVDLNQALEVSQQAAKVSAKLLLANFGTDNMVDLESERLIKAEIEKVFPDHNILGEEEGLTNKNSDYTWVIDPLDGTKNYQRQIPIFSISLALFEKNDVVLGLLHLPKFGDTYWATKNGGAFLNGKKIEVSSTADLDAAIAYLELPTSQQPNEILNRAVGNFFRIRSFGIGSLGPAYLAAGAVDAYLDLSESTKLVDIAAGIILVAEAGGYLETRSPITIGQLQVSGLWASNQKLKAKVAEIVKEK